jgi:hypothetical protein
MHEILVPDFIAALYTDFIKSCLISRFIVIAAGASFHLFLATL